MTTIDQNAPLPTVRRSALPAKPAPASFTAAPAGDSLQLSTKATGAEAVMKTRAALAEGDVKAADQILRGAWIAKQLDFSDMYAAASAAADKAAAAEAQWVGGGRTSRKQGEFARSVAGWMVDKVATGEEYAAWYALSDKLEASDERAQFGKSHRRDQENRVDRRAADLAAQLGAQVTDKAAYEQVLKAHPEAPGHKGNFNTRVRNAAADNLAVQGNSLDEMRAIYKQVFSSDDAITSQNAGKVDAFIRRAGQLPEAFELQEVAKMRKAAAWRREDDRWTEPASSGSRAGSNFDATVAAGWAAGQILGTFK